MHLVSFDDDIPEVFEKIKPGTSSDTMQPLVPGMQGPGSLGADLFLDRLKGP